MTDKNIDVLQNIEFVVHRLWKQYPEMSDSTVARGYEAAYQRYRAESRGHTPKPTQETGIELKLYEAVSDICEWRLGRRQETPAPGESALKSVPLDELVDCLRKLMKSVEFHGKTGGRLAYLRFTQQFIR